MKSKLSRRDLIKSTAVGASGVVLGKVPGLESFHDEIADTAAATASAEQELAILPLTSTSDVFIPPHGGGFFKFSFDFPEPSVRFAGLRISFRLFTFENTYAPDRDLMTVTQESDGIRIHCAGLVWAGGQQRASGILDARLRRNNGGFVEWQATAEMGVPIKSIASIVRDVPRGSISAGAGKFFDPKDEEQLLIFVSGADRCSPPAAWIRPSSYFNRARANFSLFLHSWNACLRRASIYNPAKRPIGSS